MVPPSPQALIPSSTGTTSLGDSGPPASWTWCLTPCKALFFRQRAPRLSGPAGLRRTGRGASLPAIPYFFVVEHHVHEIQRTFGEPDVVLHSPQVLILSSPSTTSLGPNGPSASRTWCLTPCNPLFLRPGAPRPRDPAGLRGAGRGASLPAIPYSFVRGHHVHEIQQAFGEPDVVLHSPQVLILSSTSTTSPGHKEPVPRRTWCFTARKPLFLRQRAPRLRGPAGLRRTGRGASLSASPYSFVTGHHVPRAQWAFGNADVVLHSPQSLILSSTGTTSLGPSRPSAMRTWCFTPRKALFLRQRAPRLSGPAGLRRTGRGASLPAIHYSFVNGHHVSRVQRASGEPDVVPHSPQAFIPSSTGTTSLGPSGPPANRTWCFTLRKPLFFRHRAPRPSGPVGLRQCGRGASRLAIHYSFVRGHHVHEIRRPTGSRH